jgi:hypothetical protein
VAFGFKYAVNLIITHPSMEASRITDKLVELQPTKAVTAGDVRVFKSGQQRPAALSVWESRLHDETELDSEAVPLTTFLEARLPSLRRYRDFFLEVRQDGHADLEIVWYSNSNHSAEVLDCGVLRELGEIGLSLDLEICFRLENGST